jgi:hypothetical protein
MATLTELYTAIILDLNRGDMGSAGELEQAKINAVVGAINKYKTEQFWFNRASGSGTTTADDATLAIPSGVYVPRMVSYGTAYGGQSLTRIPLDAIENRIETGMPWKWAEDEETIHLWPIPNAVYTLYVYGTADIDAPAAGAANIWTTECFDLMRAEAKITLCRGSLRDPEGMQLAMSERDDALAALRRESRNRDQAPLTTDIPPTRRYFNINYG